MGPISATDANPGASSPGLFTEAYTTEAVLMLAAQKAKFQSFVALALAAMPRASPGLAVRSTVRPGETPPASTLLTLPGVGAGGGRTYLGSTVVLEGTLTDVNRALRNVFFYAPFGISGEGRLAVTVSDHPRLCRGLLGGDVSGIQFAHGSSLGGMSRLTQPSDFYQVPTLSLLPRASVYSASLSSPQPRAFATARSGQPGGVDGNSSNSGGSSGVANATLCGNNATNIVTRVLPLLIVANNAPPVITLAATAFTALRGYDVFTPLPALTISDSGHEQEVILDSFGFTLSAPVTITISAVLGRVTFKDRSGLVFVQGTGLYDRYVVTRGGLMLVNKKLGGALGVGGKATPGDGRRLSELQYSCFVADGCSVGGADTITIVVNDEGFYGSGGPLTATATVAVNLI